MGLLLCTSTFLCELEVSVTGQAYEVGSQLKLKVVPQKCKQHTSSTGAAGLSSGKKAHKEPTLQKKDLQWLLVNATDQVYDLKYPKSGLKKYVVISAQCPNNLSVPLAIHDCLYTTGQVAGLEQC